MELIAKIVTANYFEKSSILDVQLGSKYAVLKPFAVYP